MFTFFLYIYNIYAYLYIIITISCCAGNKRILSYLILDIYLKFLEKYTPKHTKLHNKHIICGVCSNTSQLSVQ